jgi:hypothetical protein
MRKKFGIILFFSLLGSALLAPIASSAPTSFVASRGSAADFDGQRLRITNSSGINMGGSDFTISWWQKTTDTQTDYPRLMQFGAGNTYKEGFAISEESDGNIYLWIGGNTYVTNLSIPAANNWNHIALTRTNGDTFRWFLDGLAVKTTIDPNIEPFDTSGLDLLLGGGDDVSSGTFNGQIAGFQISQSVRWPGTTTFTPPVDFQTPDSGLAFSMYGSVTTISDLSTNSLAVNNPGVTVTDWNPPGSTPSPTAPDSPTSVSATAGDNSSTFISWIAPVSDGGSDITVYKAITESGQFCTSNDTECRINGLTNGISYTFTVTATNEIGTSAPSSPSTPITPTPYDLDVYPFKIALDYEDQETFLWGDSLNVYREEDAPYFDFGRIKHVSIGVPVTYEDANNTQVSTICYLELPDGVGENDESEIEIVMTSLLSLVINLVGSTCEGKQIPDYQHGMLGETQTDISIYLWTQETVTDFSAVGNAFEELQITMDLPPQISEWSITRGDNTEDDPGRISFGDTITVTTIKNEAAIANMAMIFTLPESGADENFCRYYLDPIADSDIYGRTFVLPTLEDLLIECYEQFPGGWIFDEEAEHLFTVMAYDEKDNFLPAGILVLNPVIDRTPPTEEPTPPKKTILEESTPQQETQPTPPAPTPPAPTPPAPTPPAPTPPAPTPPAPTPDQKVITPEPVVTVAEKPIKSSLVAKACIKAGVWIFTKNNLLQICDTELKIVLAIPACTGKEATPTYPWLFKAQRFKPGYSSSQSGQKLYYSVFFFKSLAIAGVEKVSSKPCSNGSVLIEKKHAKQVYDYIAENKSLIWVKS